MTPAEISNREHMERVRAVHRRSAYQRVLNRIGFYSAWEREAKAGLRPPLPDDCRGHLLDLLALKAELEGELIAHGQPIGGKNFDLREPLSSA